MPNTLSIKNLSCNKGEFCLFEQRTFDLRYGQALQIRGANGVGKTSLLRIIAGLGIAECGQILWNQQPISEVRCDYASNLHYIGHKSGFKEDLSAIENLQFSYNITRETAIAALIKLGVADQKDLLFRNLSAGQKRRAVLAKLIVANKLLWILDEPFTAVDKAGVQLLLDLMQQHLEQNGMIIFTSHQEVNLSQEQQEIEL